MASQSGHPDDVHALYGRLDGSPLTRRYIEVDGRRVHVIEGGVGPPVVVLHGTGGPALFYRPLLERLTGVRVFAPDRPGQGLSDPGALPRRRFREAAVAWVAGLLDTLELHAPTLVGHSMGGLWSTWFALANPERVSRLVLLAGAPALPGEVAPLPYRVMGTPGLGRLVQRMAPPTAASTVRFATMVGEGATIGDHPDLIELLVATGRDPVAATTDRNEVRAVLAPHVLLVPSAFRRTFRVTEDELRVLKPPTLMIWGDREPLGSVDVARALADLVPDGRLEVYPAGHAPWLGNGERLAMLVSAFATEGSTTPAAPPDREP
ncbi:alpha/beta fold hydrolase [Egicoccus sp. AB-alg6-2]|uniref:alpha/beta fold hydrolase n=1 Tax=Egicoccus sp. AB-alg6-2 TaxID=3242692 RepID=UPI00359D1B04